MQNTNNIQTAIMEIKKLFSNDTVISSMLNENGSYSILVNGYPMVNVSSTMSPEEIVNNFKIKMNDMMGKNSSNSNNSNSNSSKNSNSVSVKTSGEINIDTSLFAAVLSYITSAQTMLPEYSEISNLDSVLTGELKQYSDRLEPGVLEKLVKLQNDIQALDIKIDSSVNAYLNVDESLRSQLDELISEIFAIDNSNMDSIVVNPDKAFSYDVYWKEGFNYNEWNSLLPSGVKIVGKRIERNTKKTIDGKDYQVTTSIPIFDPPGNYSNIPYVCIIPGTGEVEHSIKGINNHKANVWNRAFEVSDDDKKNKKGFDADYDYTQTNLASYPFVIEMMETIPGASKPLNTGGIGYEEKLCKGLVTYLNDVPNQSFNSGSSLITVNSDIILSGHSSGSKIISDLMYYMAKDNESEFNFSFNKVVVSGGGHKGKIHTVDDQEVRDRASSLFDDKVVMLLGSLDEHNNDSKGQHAKGYATFEELGMLDEELLGQYTKTRKESIMYDSKNDKKINSCVSQMSKYTTDEPYSLPITHDQGSNENALLTFSLAGEQLSNVEYTPFSSN